MSSIWTIALGAALSGLGTIAANSEVRNNTTYGLLKLTLHQSSYDWRFLPVDGRTFSDHGSGTCN